MKNKTVDVIIPAYRPDERFNSLIEKLSQQTLLPQRILVMNTERSLWEQAPVCRAAFEAGHTAGGVPLTLVHLPQAEFDHGGTRDRAAAMSQADVLLFMTQDAVPADEYLIERLTAQLGENAGGEVAAAYARQLPAKDCSLLERCTRSYNYGEKSRVKSIGDLPELGIKTYFCSNVCAAYVRSVYEKLGGFEKQTIFNEDMIFAAKLIKAGYRIAYAADAQVVHSHNYSGKEQFKRNFDLAVSQAEHPEIFAEVPSEKEGIRLVKSTAAFLCRRGRIDLLPKLVWQSGCKYLGYFFGRRYRVLPKRVVLACSMNRKYWKNKVF